MAQINANYSVNKIFVRKYRLPEIRTRLPTKTSQLNWRSEVDKWVDWCGSYSGLTEKKMAYFKSLAFCQYCYPLCNDLYRLEVLNKLIIMGTSFDDHVEFNETDAINDDDTKLKFKYINDYAQIFDKLEGKKYVMMTDWGTVIAGCYAGYEAIYQTFNECQKHRFLEVNRYYVNGVKQELEFMMSGAKYTCLKQYFEIRSKTVAMREITQLIEYALNIFVPEYFWDDPRVQRLLDIMEIQTFLINDIYSFEKESNETQSLDNMSNSVALLSQLEGIPIEESMERLAKMLADNENEFLEIESELLSKQQLSADTKSFLEGCKYLLSSILTLHQMSKRFNM